jgi:hypothetical protein
VRRRPAIVGIEGDVDDQDARVTVTLDWKDAQYHGQSLGDAETNHRPRLAGEATLRAVERLCGNKVDLELLAIAAMDFGPARIALAQVRLDGDEVLVGNAIVDEGDTEMAAARAVMDALNRRLGLII